MEERGHRAVAERQPPEANENVGKVGRYGQQHRPDCRDHRVVSNGRPYLGRTNDFRFAVAGNLRNTFHDFFLGQFVGFGGRVVNQVGRRDFHLVETTEGFHLGRSTQRVGHGLTHFIGTHVFLETHRVRASAFEVDTQTEAFEDERADTDQDDGR